MLRKIVFRSALNLVAWIVVVTAIGGSYTVLAQGGGAEQLRSKLAELDKLRADKIINEAEYAEMRRTALDAYSRGASSATAGAAATSASATPEAASEHTATTTPLDQSTPEKTIETFKNAWNAHDATTLVHLLSSDLKAQLVKDGGAEAIGEKMETTKVVNGKVVRNEKDVCVVLMTNRGRDGSERSREMQMRKVGDSWYIASQ